MGVTWKTFLESNNKSCYCFTKFQQTSVSILMWTFNWNCLLSMLDTIYHNADDKKATLLVALDLSMTFDRMDKDALVRCLKLTFGISGLALSWVHLYLTDRKQFARVGNSKSTPAVCEFSVSQRSVLRPLLYTLYVAPVCWRHSTVHFIKHHIVS